MAMGRRGSRDPGRSIDERTMCSRTLAELIAIRGANHFYHNKRLPWRSAHLGKSAMRKPRSSLALLMILLPRRFRASRRTLWHWPARPSRRKSQGGISTSAATDRTCPRETAVSNVAGRIQRECAAWPTVRRPRRCRRSIDRRAGHTRHAKPVRTVGSYWPTRRHCSTISAARCRRTPRQSLSDEDGLCGVGLRSHLNVSFRRRGARCKDGFPLSGCRTATVRRRPAAGRQNR